MVNTVGMVIIWLTMVNNGDIWIYIDISIYIDIYGGFHKSWYPIVDGLEWKIHKLMMIGGTPISGNLHFF